MRRLLPVLLLLTAGIGTAGPDAAPTLAQRVAGLRRQLGAPPDALGMWAEVAAWERDRCDLEAARRAYDHLLAEDLLDPVAHAGHAQIHLLLSEPEQALASAGLALATPRGRALGAAWRAKAMALVDLGRYAPALVAARRGVRVAPDDARVVEALARAAFRAGDLRTAREAYLRATQLDPLSEAANLRLGSGFGPADDARPAGHAPHRVRFDAAVAAWEAGHLTQALHGFQALVRAVPEAFQFRLGLGLVLRALRRRSERILQGEAGRAYFLLPAPAVPELSKYVTNWSTLPAWARRVLQISTAPARPWMGAILKYGATHQILPLSEALDAAPSRRALRDMRTFDGRWYAHLRGVGGVAAATGIEKLKAASTFSFNTYAHEFAHQLLRRGFPLALRKRVDALYVQARNTGRCLDYYAASNVDEYFAQGYEALVSLRKRGCLRDTARHTREELIARDPALFAFFAEVLDLSHETPAGLRAFERAAPTGSD